MTEKAESVIVDAFQLIGVLGEEEPFQPAMAQTGIRFMNRMMARLAAIGLDLGYTEVTNLASPITVPLGAVEGIISNLARLLGPQYSVPVGQEVVIAARKGIVAMNALATNIGPSRYPDNLPRGSGNDVPGFTSSHFYPDLENTILAETPGSIGLEDGTYEDVNP